MNDVKTMYYRNILNRDKAISRKMKKNLEILEARQWNQF